MARKHLLIVANTPSENAGILRDAVVRGAQSPDIEDVEVRALDPWKLGRMMSWRRRASSSATTENLGYMSGALKDFSTASTIPASNGRRGFPMPCTFAQAMTEPEPVEP